jgi:hypothetical protein
LAEAENNRAGTAILEVNVDITQRRAAEEALRLSNAALLRANEGLNQFAFAASHTRPTADVFEAPIQRLPA